MKTIVSIPRIELLKNDNVEFEFKFSGGESLQFQCTPGHIEHMMTRLADASLALAPERETLVDQPLVDLDISSGLVRLTTGSGQKNRKIYTLFHPAEALDVGQQLIAASKKVSAPQEEH